MAAMLSMFLFLLIKKLVIAVVAMVAWFIKFTMTGEMDLLEAASKMEVRAAMREGREVSQDSLDRIFEELKAQKRRKKA